jgi:hypothetical protein
MKWHWLATRARVAGWLGRTRRPVPFVQPGWPRVAGVDAKSVSYFIYFLLLTFEHASWVVSFKTGD